MKKRILISIALVLILCVTFVGQSYGASYIYYGSKEYDTIKTNAISIGGVGERLFDFALNAVSVSSRKTN